MSNVAFLFPGQGSQKVGMGQAWAEAHAEARAVFEEADDVLGFDLTRLCWEGPDDELMLTANTQPALVTVSVAMLRVLQAAGLRPIAAAGHSLGEYAALVAADVISFADALRLVRRRGELMQEAVPVGVGAMAAIIGLEQDEVEAVAEEARADADEVCAVANVNAPGQTVIAGHAAPVGRAVAIAEAKGARKAKLLPVSAPFHSSLMAPARIGLEPMLAATAFARPTMPVVTNIDARPVTDGGAGHRDALVRQIDGPVRWVESMRWLIDEVGVDSLVEVGSGSVLCGLGRRIQRGVTWRPLPSPAAVEKIVSA